MKRLNDWVPAYPEMPFWAPWALVLQLILSFFAPPISVGGRSLYLGEIVGYLWLPVAFVQMLRIPQVKSRAEAIRPMLVTFSIFLLVFVHGRFRPLLFTELRRSYADIQPDLFQPGRELVVALRFAAWACESFIVAAWLASCLRAKRALKIFRVAGSAVFVAVLGEVVLMAIARVSPPFGDLLGRLFRYSPQASPWQGRMYGTFGSPVEAGVALGFALVLLAAVPRERGTKRAVGTVVALVGIVLTKTATPFVALASGAVAWALSTRRKLRKVLPATGAVALGVAFLSVRLLSPDLLRGKVADFVYRVEPWKVFLKSAMSRWDLLFLGSGFPSYHVDNGYLFILNRGGLVLLGWFGFWLTKGLNARWSFWSVGQRAVVIYLLVSAFAVDAFIFRVVVALFVCAGLPLLSVRGEQIQ